MYVPFSDDTKATKGSSPDKVIQWIINCHKSFARKGIKKVSKFGKVVCLFSSYFSSSSKIESSR